jgi:Fe-Mn family superoxide dismutase
MNREHFLKSDLLVGTGSILTDTNAFAYNLSINNIDKLVDAKRNYVLQALPYTENFLEPFLDKETCLSFLFTRFAFHLLDKPYQ